jgi:hypothetical protein
MNKTTDDAMEIMLSIQETVDKLTHEENSGFWYTCSGCCETSDGYTNDYPYSDVFQCTLGSGCSECGGIGARWDNTEYDISAITKLMNEEIEIVEKNKDLKSGDVFVNVYFSDFENKIKASVYATKDEAISCFLRNAHLITPISQIRVPFKEGHHDY